MQFRRSIPYQINEIELILFIRRNQMKTSKFVVKFYKNVYI